MDTDHITPESKWYRALVCQYTLECMKTGETGTEQGGYRYVRDNWHINKPASVGDTPIGPKE